LFPPKHTAKQISPYDLSRYDYILAMDRETLEVVQALANAYDATEGFNQPMISRIALLNSYLPNYNGKGIDDPFYGEQKDFDWCLRDIIDGCKAFIARFDK
jgi:protein-tyrosine-phosphatase